jgi:hypothetical protein
VFLLDCVTLLLEIPADLACATREFELQGRLSLPKPRHEPRLGVAIILDRE